MLAGASTKRPPPFFFGLFPVMAAAWKQEWMETIAVTQAGTFQLQVPGSCSEPRWAWLLQGFFLGGDGGGEGRWEPGGGPDHTLGLTLMRNRRSSGARLRWT